jgi:hypothetical protein
MSREKIAADDRLKSLLAAVLLYHVLPPLEEYGRAVWSAPFMRPGVKMATALPGAAALAVAGSNASDADLWELPKIKLVRASASWLRRAVPRCAALGPALRSPPRAQVSPKNGAAVALPDIYVCKVGTLRLAARCSGAKRTAASRP